MSRLGFCPSVKGHSVSSGAAISEKTELDVSRAHACWSPGFQVALMMVLCGLARESLGLVLLLPPPSALKDDPRRSNSSQHWAADVCCVKRSLLAWSRSKTTRLFPWVPPPPQLSCAAVWESLIVYFNTFLHYKVINSCSVVGLSHILWLLYENND